MVLEETMNISKALKNDKVRRYGIIVAGKL
jgi:hypothetical protein